MASDLNKMKSLFEEFKERELHYLDIGRNMNNILHITKNDCSLEVQDYLQKINEREKENEDTYKKSLYQMETLHHHADQISENLIKLASLTASMSSSSAWKSLNEYGDNEFPSFSYSPNYAQTFSHLKNPVFDSYVLSSQSKSTNSASTQTDQIFCENCNFVLGSSLKPLSESFHLTTQIKQSVPLTNNKNILNSNITEDNFSNIAQATNQNDSCTSSAVISKEQSSPQVSGKAVTHSTFNEIEKSLPSLADLSNGEHIYSNELPKTSVVENVSVNEKSSEARDTASGNAAVDKVASKSDAESLNHEFDFLESDSKQVVMHEKGLHQVSEKEQSTDKTTLTKKNASDNVRKETASDNLKNESVSANLINESVSDNLNNKTISDSEPVQKGSTMTIADDVKKTPDVLNEGDRKSESSISLGGGHSPSLHSDNLSIISESDSPVEKEPLKASVAYQKLLGNVSVTKTIPKTQYSDSESEDEVEKALSKVARKNNTPTASTLNDKDQEMKKNESEVKPKSEPRKSISFGKPQQLAKNTRKVLGLDVSSGSEGEIQIPSKSKSEEDDDEFFFD